MAIKIYTEKDFEGLRKAGKLAREVLDFIEQYVEVGVSTLYLNDLCHNFIVEHGAIPAPLNYEGFPKSTCISVNHVVCHGIPSANKILKSGDILNIDITVILDGYYGDTSRMYFAGKPSIEAKRLCDVTKEALNIGIQQAKPGNTIGDIGYAIEQYVKPFHYSLVRDFCGHGTGKIFHDEPNVPHFGRRGEGPVIKEGMVFTIEPMVNVGNWQVNVSKFDGWTTTTKDKSLSAQYEHTLGITKTGCEIFTA